MGSDSEVARLAAPTRTRTRIRTRTLTRIRTRILTRILILNRILTWFRLGYRHLLRVGNRLGLGCRPRPARGRGPTRAGPPSPAPPVYRTVSPACAAPACRCPSSDSDTDSATVKRLGYAMLAHHLGPVSTEPSASRLPSSDSGTDSDKYRRRLGY